MLLSLIWLKLQRPRGAKLSYVRESTKVLDSVSQPLDFNPLDSGFQPSGFRIPYQMSGFRIPDSNPLWFRILVSGFRIPTAKICWIRISYMGRAKPSVPVTLLLERLVRAFCGVLPRFLNLVLWRLSRVLSCISGRYTDIC